MVLLCHFGRQLVTEGYKGVCRSAFNNTLIAGALHSTAVESLLKVVGLTSKGLPSPFNMFLFGAFAGGTRECIGVVIDKFDVFDIKKQYEKTYHTIRFALTFFASIKAAEYMCHDFNIPVTLTKSVVLMELGDYGLGLFVDVMFNSAPRSDEPEVVPHI
jgi:type III secretory pathway component EscT